MPDVARRGGGADTAPRSPSPAGAARRSSGFRSLLRRAGGILQPPASTRWRPGPHWLGVAAWATLALVVVATAVLWTMGDRHWVGTAMLFGPRWLILLPVTPLVLAAPFARRAAVPALLAAAIALGPFMGFRLGWQGLLPAGQDRVRVVSLNAAGLVDPVLRILDEMESRRVDIAVIQECASDVEAMLGVNAAWQLHRAYDLCLFSRYPAEQLLATRWNELDAVAGAGMGRSGTAARYVVRMHDRDVHVVNLHLETPRKGLEQLRYGAATAQVGGNTFIRSVGSRRVLEWLGPRHDHLIIMGDFNMPVESAIYRNGWSSFTNAFSTAGWGLGSTKANGWIRVRIDHVLVGRDWRVRNARVGGDVGSDHWPLFAELAARR
jgi:vancomycin resistance protein VanJ